MHKLKASFWKSTKIGQKQGMESNEKLHLIQSVHLLIFTMYIFTFIDC